MLVHLLRSLKRIEFSYIYTIQLLMCIHNYFPCKEVASKHFILSISICTSARMANVSPEMKKSSWLPHPCCRRMHFFSCPVLRGSSLFSDFTSASMQRPFQKHYFQLHYMRHLWASLKRLQTWSTVLCINHICTLPCLAMQTCAQTCIHNAERIRKSTSHEGICVDNLCINYK